MTVQEQRINELAVVVLAPWREEATVTTSPEPWKHGIAYTPCGQCFWPSMSAQEQARYDLHLAACRYCIAEIGDQS